MRGRRSPARVLWNVLLGVCFASLIGIVLIQIEQYVLRHRSEQLLNDIQSLPLGRATFSDMQRLKQKWGSAGHYEDNCSEESCTLDVLLTDLSERYPEILIERPHLFHFFMLVGGRPARVGSKVVVEKGLISGKSFQVAVGVPAYQAANGWWPDYTLIGNARSVTELSPRLRAPAAHPDYVVGVPDGCDGPCREVHFVFASSADPAIVNRFMQFDFSCLTRWIHPCRTEGDTMPGAWAQYERDFGRTMN